VCSSDLAGVGLRDTRLTADAHPGSAGTVEIGGVTIPFDTNDSASAKIKMPTVAPYLGLGWSTHPTSTAKGGWGFMADVGFYYGKPKISLGVSDSVRAKLDAAAPFAGYANGQEAIDQQTRKFRDDVNYKLFPSLYIGARYTF
jgi:hypothetical protein